VLPEGKLSDLKLPAWNKVKDGSFLCDLVGKSIFVRSPEIPPQARRVLGQGQCLWVGHVPPKRLTSNKLCEPRGHIGLKGSMLVTCHAPPHSALHRVAPGTCYAVLSLFGKSPLERLSLPLGVFPRAVLFLLRR